MRDETRQWTANVLGKHIRWHWARRRRPFEQRVNDAIRRGDVEAMAQYVSQWGRRRPPPRCVQNALTAALQGQC